ncbi:hypothetical protein [Nocardia carnea]|uniref:Uncharacterized protein n=1 Tax=Nocardia carnea TaxID=37328 RepID=A0ABW7TJ12_9NOCA|nr:hypothetical protein [Nocardia carnea]
MIPIQITPDLLPAISAGFAAQEANLVGTIQTTASELGPEPTGPHMPGLLMSVGFGVFGAVLTSLLGAGSAEKLDGVARIVPAAGAFKATDTAGGVSVAAVGDSVAPSVFGN